MTTDYMSANMPGIGLVRIPFSNPHISDKSAAAAIADAMQDLCRTIRHGSPAVHDESRRTLIATTDERLGYVAGKPVPRLVITVRPTGCWWGKKAGGCVMCGHHMAAVPPPLDSKQLLREFREIAVDIENRNIKVLCIYNGGSVLNPGEFPELVLQKICKMVSMMASIKKLVIETRPEFVDPTRLQLITSLLREDQRLVAAIGVETIDDNIRRLCINKGFDIQDLMERIQIDEADFRFYLFFGAPFLTEAEIISDTFTGITSLTAVKLDEIHVEPATLQRGSPLMYLWRNGIYDLPSLWSLVFLLRALPPNVHVYISPFNHFPMPDHIPTTCNVCSQAMLRALNQYNETHDPLVFDQIRCQCLDSWLSRISERDSRPLEDRVATGLARLRVAKRLIRPFHLEEWWGKHAGGAIINIGSSGVAPLSLEELNALQGRNALNLNKILLDDTNPEGLPTLREQIAERYDHALPDNCVVTCGATEALALAFQDLPKTGRILTFHPCYQPLYSLPVDYGHEVISIPLVETNSGWMPNLDVFDKECKEPLTAIIINSPHNPTGMIMPDDLLESIVSMSERWGTWIIADESFADLLHPQNRLSMYSRAEKCIVVNTMSKSFGLPGIRIGWLVGPKQVVQRSIRRKSYLSLSCSVIDQLIAMSALSVADELLRKHRNTISANLAWLNKVAPKVASLISIYSPAGGTCCFPKIQIAKSSRDVSIALKKKHGVFILPGDVFGYPQHLRLGLGTPEKRFANGVELLIHELSESGDP